MSNFKPIPGLPGAYWVRGPFGIFLGILGTIAFIACIYFWAIAPAIHAQSFDEEALQREHPNGSISLMDEKNVDGKIIKVFRVTEEGTETYAVLYDITRSSFEEQEQVKDSNVSTQTFSVDNTQVSINTDTDKVSYTSQ